MEADKELQEIKQLEEDIAKLGAGDSKGYPEPPPKDSVFKFFRDILNLKDSSKAANLDMTELGKLPLTVRGYLDIANYANAEGLDKVAKYLDGKAQIVLATSLSKKGFLPQLFVTQIKKEQKPKLDEKKKGFFTKKEEEE